MKQDTLKEFTRLRSSLFEEKNQILQRLTELNQVLGPDSAKVPDLSPASPSVSGKRRGRRTGNGLTLREAVINALSKRPLKRSELVDAIQAEGYRFNTKNPLNSIGAVLYGKNSPVEKSGDTFRYIGETPTKAIPTSSSAPEPKKRTMSPEGRARIAAAARARWAKQRGTSKAAMPGKRTKKRTMSPEARARISAAAKARWAKSKA